MVEVGLDLEFDQTFCQLLVVDASNYAPGVSYSLAVVEVIAFLVAVDNVAVLEVVAVKVASTSIAVVIVASLLKVVDVKVA